jgi:hypothetical protein
MKLAEAQSLFQRSILTAAPDPRLLALLRPSVRAADVAETFAVYHDGYRLRMTEFLTNDYPVLRQAIGEIAFEAMVRTYWRAHPSRFRNARWFGAGLPQFLRVEPPYAGDGFVCGLAALEAALAQSFDAEDSAPLPIEILGVTSEEDWPRLCFGFDESVIVVETTAAALAAYEAFHADELVPDARDGAEIGLLVWRRDLDVNYRALDSLERLALLEAKAGAPFGQICAALTFSHPEREAEQMTQAAGGFLARWFADAMIVAAAPAPQ